MAFVLRLSLCCPVSDRVERTLEFEEKPETVSQVKARIESELHVPALYQSVYYKSSKPLQDEDRLDSYHIQDGEVLVICCSSNVDVENKRVLNAVGGILATTAFIRSIHTQLVDRETALGEELESRLTSENIRSEQIKCLNLPHRHRSTHLLLFVHSNGLELLFELLRLLLRYEFSILPTKLQALVVSVIETVFRCVQSVPNKVFLREDYFETLLQTVVRIRLPCSDAFRTIQGNPFDLATAARPTVCRHSFTVMCYAVPIVHKLVAKYPECHREVAENGMVLNHLIALMYVQKIFLRHSTASLRAIQILLHLSNTQQCHVHLTAPFIIYGIMKAHREFCSTSRTSTYRNILMFKFYSSLLFAVLATSSSVTSLSMKLSIHWFLILFLETADHRSFPHRDSEKAKCWRTLEPFVRLALFPYRNTTCTNTTYFAEENRAMKDLQLRCIELGVFALQVATYSDVNKQLLIEEGLMDYVLCLPWSVPKESKAEERAIELVSCLRRKMQLQPPTLVNLTKARLASMFFGLEKVRTTGSFRHLVAEAYPQTLE